MPFSRNDSRVPPVHLGDLPPPPPGMRGWPWTEESAPLSSVPPGGGFWPSISIISPSFQQGRFLEKTIRSVLLQGYPSLEYVIVDGGSTDETLSVIKRYERFLGSWVSEADDGQVQAIEKGFAVTTGEVWTWINSDDWLMPNALRAVAEACAAHPEAGIFVGGGIRLDQNGKELHRLFRSATQIANPIFWHENNFMQPSTFIRRYVSMDVGPLDPSFFCTFDYEFWVRASRRITFVPVPALLSGELDHPAAKTVAWKSRMWREMITIARRDALSSERRKIAAMIWYMRWQSAVALLPSWLQRLLHKMRLQVLRPFKALFRSITQ